MCSMHHELKVRNSFKQSKNQLNRYHNQITQTGKTCANKNTVKPVLSGHSKIDQTKILMTNGSLMKVESIAECCNTFDLH